MTKSIKQNPPSPRVVLAVLAGAVASFLFISLMPSYVLATVLGTLIAIIIARPLDLKAFTVLGLITGAIVGPYIGVRNYLAAGGMHLRVDDPGLILSFLGGLVLYGFLCAGYGFLAGKFLDLYKKGRGPFF